MSKSVPKLVLFDFDGTITSKDSYLEFIKMTHGQLRMLLGFVVISPWIVLWKIGIINSSVAKQYSFWWFYGGWSEKDFDTACKRFVSEKIPSILRDDAMQMLRLHIGQGHRVVLVSASIENYLQIWTQEIDIELLCTRPAMSKGKLSGRFDGLNCQGAEKARRIREAYAPEEYSYIYAYGDSKGDKEMLELAHEPHYRLFV